MSIKEIVERVGHYLPSQGPLDVFIHHNTLHAFQHLRFEEGVEAAARLYGAKPYLSEERYLEEFNRGRITTSDLSRVLLEEDSGETVLGDLTRGDFRLLLLLTSPHERSYQSISWRLIEDHTLLQELPVNSRRAFIKRSLAPLKAKDGAVAHYRELIDGLIRSGLRTDDSFLTLTKGLTSQLQDALSDRLPEQSLVELTLKLLWLSCLRVVAGGSEKGGWERPKKSGSRDGEELVDHFLIKFTSAFFDRGISYWRMPFRERGYLPAFLSIAGNSSLLTREDRARLVQWRHKSGEELLEELLQLEGIPEEGWEGVLSTEALALKGWAGMVHTLEHKPSLSGEKLGSFGLADYLAVRLLLKRGSRSATPNCGECHFVSSLDPIYVTALHLFLILKEAGVTAAELQGTPKQELLWMIQELDRWNPTRRQRAWHHAYEEHFEHEVYNALVVHNAGGRRERSDDRKAQLVFCIDDREESLRRYIEAEDEGFETLGAAGFFGVDVNYQPLRDRGATYCPPVITPKHQVVEVPGIGKRELADGIVRSSRKVGRVIRGAHTGSHTLVRGGVLSSTVGALALIPLVGRIIAPALEERVRRLIDAILDEVLNPQLVFEKESEECRGFTVEEMASRVGTILRATGLTSNFARLVVVVGHGSASKNNPLKSAYDCGACGGRPGKINPRVFALMANHEEVRDLLSDIGIVIPSTTYFVGAYHNTCADTVEYYDTESIPGGYREEFNYLGEAFARALARNALERCRRFHLCEPGSSPRRAQALVESRSCDVREPRPEYGHATNALCIIGKRERTKGLFLDRRSFLISYDADQDPDGDILLGLLGAVIPVCAGINLEYFFSAADNGTYGAGTKLPHNVASLLGVMNGWSGDLRTGLPQQMVEIHEAVRLVTVLECSEEKLRYVLTKNPALREIIENQWIRLALYDGEVNTLRYLERDGRLVAFEGKAPIPSIQSIESYIAGREEHLQFATFA